MSTARPAASVMRFPFISRTRSTNAPLRERQFVDYFSLSTEHLAPRERADFFPLDPLSRPQKQVTNGRRRSEQVSYRPNKSLARFR